MRYAKLILGFSMLISGLFAAAAVGTGRETIGPILSAALMGGIALMGAHAILEGVNDLLKRKQARLDKELASLQKIEVPDWRDS